MTVDTTWLEAVEVARLIAQGELTPSEVVASAVDRMRRMDPVLNVVVSDLGDAAVQACGRAFGMPRPARTWPPLAGVPFLRKDLGVAVSGEPLYLGNRALKEADYRPTWTSDLARRFSRLGLRAIGTTNTPEMGAQTTTQPLSTGPTRNPWNVSLSSSGSSGGSAAAVAAGVVPVAHANDYLGSTRLPAAWQGIYGLKPSRGRVPLGPSAVSRMSSECVVTRSVRDLATVLDGIAGPGAGELWVALPCPQPFAVTVARAVAGQLGPLRVGVLTRSPSGIPVHPTIGAAVQEAGRVLQDWGHEVSEAFPRALVEADPGLPRYDRGSDYRRRIRVIESLLGRQVEEQDVEPFLWAMAQRGGETVDEHLAAEVRQQEWSARVTGWWEQDGYDILLTPTVAMFPEPLELLAVNPDDPTEFFSRHVARHIAFTVPFNVTGQPAMAVPFATTSPGESASDPDVERSCPPPSIQIVGAPHRDDLVLAVAAQLEVSRPSIGRPPMSADAREVASGR